MKLIKTIILTILLTLTANIALAYNIQGTVTYVYDGDTVLLEESTYNTTPQALRASSPIRGASPAKQPCTLIRGALHRIRLASIDAPEKDQPYGLEATLLLRRLIQNKTVLANVIDTDKYGRKIAYIKLVTPQALRASSPIRGALPAKQPCTTIRGASPAKQPCTLIRGALVDISSIMLAKGAAWHYKAFDKTSAQYDLHYALEQEARTNKRGLWSQDYPIAPWIWRRNMPL